MTRESFYPQRNMNEETGTFSILLFAQWIDYEMLGFHVSPSRREADTP